MTRAEQKSKRWQTRVAEAMEAIARHADDLVVVQQVNGTRVEDVMEQANSSAILDADERMAQREITDWRWRREMMAHALSQSVLMWHREGTGVPDDGLIEEQAKRFYALVMNPPKV